MNKICSKCQQEFNVYPQDKDFYKSIDVPEPEMCPQCRFQLINSYRNERTLYNRKCDSCKADIISMYSSDKPYAVYCHSCFWSDKWNPLDYAQDFDFNKSFFEQFKELRNKVPRLNLLNDDTSENSTYTNHVYHLKNCYILSDACYNENCLYGNGIYNSTECVDCSYVTNKSELCYETTFSEQCYNVKYCDDCHTCRDSAFLIDCRGCSDCFMCVGLRNKKYCIKNKEYSEQEYCKFVETLHVASLQKINQYKKEFNDFALTVPRKYFHGNKNENSTGDYILNNKSVHHCYHMRSSEQCAYCFGMDKSKNCYDVMVYGEDAEQVYQAQATGGQVYKILFGNAIWHGQENYYCDNCLNGAEYCFGSISLKKHKYCILNKQYSQGEFMKLREKIINYMKETGEWGNYFPQNISLFAYNESDAQGFFPLSKEKALSQGFSWQDNMPGTYSQETLTDIPDNINDIDISITKEIIKCENCQKNFKYTESEIKFYEQQNIPLPNNCPDCRYRDRLKLRPAFKLYNRKCMNPGCNNKFETTYSPNRKEIIYCEECYQKEIY
ncbi:MAG: zinc-ribbon domain containing protein [Patescibacteria group bacterium]